MTKVGTAEWDVEISRTKVAAEVDAASRQIERGLGDSAKKVSSDFSNAARVAVAGFAGAATVRFLGDSIQAASNLAEQQSKVGVVFGETAEQVQAFAESAAESYGLSERAALEATGTFGNLFASVGIGQQEAADMSVKLTQLAADLASFENVPIEDAFLALRSGLVGEQEPLRRFGVNINEAALRLKAMELGLSDGKSVLDANAKSQAAYALILEQTTNAQGDVERTSGSLANKQKFMAAEFENSKAQLGEGLIPVAKIAVDVFGDLANVVGGLPSPVLTAGVALGSITAAVGILGPVFKSGVSSMAELGRGASGLVSKLTGTTNAIGALGAAGPVAAGGLGVLAFALVDYIGQTERAKANTEALRQAFEDGAAPVDALNEKLARTVAGADGGFELDTSNDKLNLYLEKTGTSITELSEILQLSESEWDDWYKESTRAGGAQTLLAQTIDGIRGAYVDAQREQEALRASQELLGVETDKTTAATEDQAGAVEKLAGTYEEELEKLTAAFDAQRAAEDARRNTIDAVRDVAEAEAAARGNSDEYRRAQEAIADAEGNLADAAKDLAVARREVSTDSDAYRDAQRGVADAERAVADAQRSTQRAQEDLTQARKDAAEQLEDLALAAESASLAEERARLRVEEARAAIDDVRNDPRSTDRDVRDVRLSLREAELALKEAQDRNQDSAAELADANAKGVEGSDAVVAAKERVQEAIRSEQDARLRLGDATRRVSQVIVAAQERVVEAQERVADAEAAVADANQAAADVIEDAKERHREAVRNVEDAILDQADAERDLALATGDAVESTDIYIESLSNLSGFLDPNSKFRRNLGTYIEDLRELQRINEPPPGANGYGVVGTIGAVGTPMGPPSPPGPRNINVNVTTGANPKEIGDALMWED